MKEDLLAQLLRDLTNKENPPAQDDNTLIQKIIAPQETTQMSDDNISFTKLNTSLFVWGGYVSATYYPPNWTWCQGMWK